jgi:hypothetical protein
MGVQARAKDRSMRAPVLGELFSVEIQASPAPFAFAPPPGYGGSGKKRE